MSKLKIVIELNEEGTAKVKNTQGVFGLENGGQVAQQGLLLIHALAVDRDRFDELVAKLETKARRNANEEH